MSAAAAIPAVALCPCMSRPAVVRGRCRPCWARSITTFQTQYQFDDALTAELRAAYKVRGKEQRAAIAALVRKTGWPRPTFSREAQRLGIAEHQPIWTAEEDRYLLAHVGEMSIKAIARKLNRTYLATRKHAQV